MTDGLPTGRDDRRERMQRIRVGLTGLAVVLLLVVLATALFTRVGDQAVNSGAPVTGAADKGANGNTADEPLAELGVTPGAVDNKEKPEQPPGNRR